MSLLVSVKERVLVQLKSKFEAMTDDDNNGISFMSVERNALDRDKKIIGNALGLVDLTELYGYQTSYLLNSLRIALEFNCKIPYSDEEASSVLNAVLAELKRVIAIDPNLVEDGTGLQLTEDIKFVDYEPDIETSKDKIVSGFLQFDVFYRTEKENPYILR